MDVEEVQVDATVPRQCKMLVQSQDAGVKFVDKVHNDLICIACKQVYIICMYV